jgi:secreted Zn-dependent insulinase-like peptidase
MQKCLRPSFRSDIFEHIYRSEISYLKSKGIVINISLDSDLNVVRFFVEGNSLASLGAMKWFMHEFFTFNFTNEQKLEVLSLEKDNLLLSEKNTHPAQTAVRRLYSGLNYNRLERKKILERSESLEPAYQEKLFAHMVSQGAQRSIVAVGDFSVDEIKQWAANGLPYLKGLKSNLIKTPNFSFSPHSKESIIFESSLLPGNPGNNYAVARSFMGPQLSDLRESTIATLLGRLLAVKLAEINRSQKQLGYIHGAASLETNYEHLVFVLYGQNGDPQKISLLLEGWRELIEKITLKTLINVEEFEKLRRTAIERYLQKPTTQEGIVSEYARNVSSYQDPFINVKKAGILQEITLDDLYQVAEKYLVNKRNFVQHLASSDANQQHLCQASLVGP